MNKSIRIQRALINHRLIANLLNLLIFFLSVIALYFLVLYIFFGLCGNYNTTNNKISEIEASYSLNLNSDATYQDYEEVVKDFYFNRFKEEICNYYYESYGKSYSITKIYNISVLGLPSEPTHDNYKTNYYQYIQNSDGSFNTEAVGIMVEGYGDFYERNLLDLFVYKYNSLFSLLEEFDTTYYQLKVEKNALEMYSRIIAFLVAFITMYIVLPLLNKYYQVGFEMKLSLASVNKRNGYLIPKYKYILKNIIMMIIPFIGILLANKYSIIILTIGYLFLDIMIMMLSKNNTSIEEALLQIEVCSVKESLIFKNKLEEDEYISSEEFKKINDIDYLEKLKAVDEIEFNDKKIE